MTTNVSVSRITLFSADMDKAAEFYKAIGLNLQKSIHGWGPNYNYLDVIDNGGQHIIFEIYSLRSGTIVSPQGLGFNVENLPDVIGRLVEIKAPLMRPWILKKRPEILYKCTYATFQDPDGRTVSLTQHEKVRPA